jgi:hypothetical protein
MFPKRAQAERQREAARQAEERAREMLRQQQMEFLAQLEIRLQEARDGRKREREAGVRKSAQQSNAKWLHMSEPQPVPCLCG